MEAILEVVLNANSGLINELRGDVEMGEMILKVVQPLVMELEKMLKQKV